MSHDKSHGGLGPYIAVITALMVLTGVTVWAAFQNFGIMNNVVMLSIALVKAFLVFAIFMHLRGGARINWLFAASGAIFFIILMAFVVGDYATRGFPYKPEPWNPAAAETSVPAPR